MAVNNDTSTSSCNSNNSTINVTASEFFADGESVTSTGNFINSCTNWHTIKLIKGKGKVHQLWGDWTDIKAFFTSSVSLPIEIISYDTDFPTTKFWEFFLIADGLEPRGIGLAANCNSNSSAYKTLFWIWIRFKQFTETFFAWVRELTKNQLDWHFITLEDGFYLMVVYCMMQWY